MTIESLVKYFNENIYMLFGQREWSWSMLVLIAWNTMEVKLIIIKKIMGETWISETFQENENI